MSINKKTTVRVKVSLSIEAKTALEAIAAKQGISLSRLISEAALERHLLNRKGDVENSHRMLSQQIRELQEKLSELPLASTQEPMVLTRGVGRPYEGKPKNRDHRLGCLARATTEVPSEATQKIGEAVSQHKPIHIDYLVTRLGGDSTIKGRLCVTGGKLGLFDGDLARAQKLEHFTARLDPDNLPWFPTAADRVWWVQKDALSFVKEVLNSG